MLVKGDIAVPFTLYYLCYTSPHTKGDNEIVLKSWTLVIVF